MPEEKEYIVVEDAMETIRRLKERYPRHLWAVVPEEIVVLGLTNKDRPSGMRKMAWIKKLEPEFKAMLAWHRSVWKYYIEFYCSEYRQWGEPLRQWVLFHELVHVPGPADQGVIPHDVEDFAVMVDAGGWDWPNREHLPNLLEGDPFPFKQHLVDKLHKQDEEEGR